MSNQDDHFIRVDDEVMARIRERQSELQLGSAKNVSAGAALRDLLEAPEASEEEDR